MGNLIMIFPLIPNKNLTNVSMDYNYRVIFKILYMNNRIMPVVLATTLALSGCDRTSEAEHRRHFATEVTYLLDNHDNELSQKEIGILVHMVAWELCRQWYDHTRWDDHTLTLEWKQISGSANGYLRIREAGKPDTFIAMTTEFDSKDNSYTAFRWQKDSWKKFPVDISDMPLVEFLLRVRDSIIRA